MLGSFLLLRLQFISINPSTTLHGILLIISELLLLTAACKYWISYRYGYVGSTLAASLEPLAHW